MIELLEAVSPTTASYPFPSLQRTGRQDHRSFQAIVLENPYLRATMVPDLGGRILRLQDKRTQSDVWPFDPTLTLTDGGNRGIECQAGLQVVTGLGSRLNSMGSVTTSPDFSGEEEEPTGIWWGEICGNGLSLNCRYSIPPDEACLEIEVRAFNRTLAPIAYNGGLASGLASGVWRRLGPNWLWQGDGTQMLVEPIETSLDFAEANGSLHRFNRTRHLAPRQLDSWRVRIYPLSIGPTLRQANPQLAVGWNRDELKMQASVASEGCKVVVRTQDYATLELPVDLFPEHETKIDLASLSSEIVELAVLDPHRIELIRASNLPEPTSVTREKDEQPPNDYPTSESDLLAATFDVRYRHLAHLLLAHRHLAAKNYRQATHAFEQSLLFNAEDHLAWWSKAIAERLAGEDGEERPELLNAHFLAPLEPALRAESYLASPSQTKEKAAILNPLEATPEAFIEIACLLIEANLLEEAAKWIDEALRHLDMPMLRYLLAFAYLKGSRMDVQAAEQVQMAIRQQPEPPYPWRKVELQALHFLIERFPADSSLRRLVAIAGLPVA